MPAAHGPLGREQEQERNRSRALAIVLRHGSDATAFQTLQPGYCYFFYGEDACVAYADTGRAWIAAGSPIAAPAVQGEVLEAFLAAARRARKRVCFFATERPLTTSKGEALHALAIGEQPTWDPRDWPSMLTRRRSLREQLRRARSKGVTTRELGPEDLQDDVIRQAVRRVVDRWLSRRTLAPMGFLVRVEPFDFAEQRRSFVAERNGRVVGFASLVPVPARNGWFLEDLVRDPAAPNGTGELLVHAAMTWASATGCGWLTLGLAPLSGQLPKALRVIRDQTRFLYDFAGLRAYKAKFRPNHWQPMYLCVPNAQPLWLSMIDALTAFAQGGLVRFGVRTLLRGPTVVLKALAILLVPWTLLLMLAPSARWFGPPWGKWCWIGFDAALLLGLFELLRQPRPRLLTALAIAISADALLTTLEALFWNVRHVQRELDYLILWVACAGPSLAAVVLWGARRHRSRFS